MYGGVVGINDFAACMDPIQNNACAKNATSEIVILDEVGSASYLHPYNSDPVPAVYGHVSALVEDL